MQYTIRHISHFLYEAPISSSVMEVRMCPRTEAQQHCYTFDLELTPHAQLFSYRDFLGNTIHHFSIAGTHEELRLESNALVEVRPLPDPPDALPEDTWTALDAQRDDDGLLEMTLPSAFAAPSEALLAFGREIDLRRRDDPLSVLRELNAAVHDGFAYNSESTHVNSPIDDALESRSGVCQDFAHLFITLARELGIPCRYVSGYLFHRSGDGEDGDRSAEDGSHAWVEAFLPGLGWVGFDPTNNILAGERHIRVAVGRDYADVPPSRGVFKGSARSTLRVGVHVGKARFPVGEDVMPKMALVRQEDQIDAETDLFQTHQQQ